MVEVGCLARPGQHFHEALDADPSRMRTVLLLIAQLYAVERAARERGFEGEPLRLLREQGSRPVLERLHAYLLEIQDQLLPKSEAGQAVAYTLKNWIALTRYCENPDLSIDNSATKRTLRCFAVGRANWTFFGSDSGGKTAAVLRSFAILLESW
jgi:transposase